MKFGGIGIPELVIILVVVLLIFGPKNLPKLGSAIGKATKNLREGMGGKKDEGESESEAEEEAVEVVEEVEDPVPGAAPKKKVVKKVVKKSE